MRLDQWLVAAGLAQSRERAKALILDGKVQAADGRVLTKPGLEVEAADGIRLTGADFPWVSRGALKLLAALDAFGLDPAGAVAVDVGASTGGFTEVLLARGAATVHAVDVGHDQLAERLRNDPRVVVREGTNARHLSAADFPQPPDWLVCDASFISLELVLPAVLAAARSGAQLVCLIKPQFEVGRARVGKKGVVKDPALHAEVCDRIAGFLQGLGWRVQGIVPSPVPGPEGNLEFLLSARKEPL